MLVLLDGWVVGETGVDGRFGLPLPSQRRARLTIVTPEGFEWLGEPMSIDERVLNVAIPLRQTDLKVGMTKGVTKIFS